MNRYTIAISTDYVCACVCVCGKENTVQCVHFRLLNLSNNCKQCAVLGRQCCQATFSRFIVYSFIFFYIFCLPQSHVSRLLLYMYFSLLLLLFQMQLESFLLFGDQEEINRRALILSLLQTALTWFFALLTNTRQNEK